MFGKFIKIVLIATAMSGITLLGDSLSPESTATALLAKVSSGTIALPGNDGWIYSKNELEHLAAGKLSDGEIVKKSKSAKKINANPIPAIVDFNNQLKELGIELILLPVPPKIAIYPEGAGEEAENRNWMKNLKEFYGELSTQGVRVIDLSDEFIRAKNASPEPLLYCKSDSHWSPAGARLAAIIVGGGEIKGKFPESESKLSFTGDLLRSLNRPDLPQEELPFFQFDSAGVDANSPILVIGDSHTLVFHSGGDMLAENGGFVDFLSSVFGSSVDVIGIKGSAATAVRGDLYRKAAKNPEWLKNKKMIIWCFTAREFTESTSGWAKIPILKR